MTDNDNSPQVSDLEEGLRFGHMLMSMNRHVSQEAVSCAQSILGLLLKKNIITVEEFEEKMEEHRKDFEKYPDVKIANLPDKYECEEVVIDCHARIHLCRAACCTFRFYLTTQDLDERVVKWDYGAPYWIRHSADGYCVHCDPEELTCQIHENRPHTCRQYDCREDERVWVNFEERIPNPELENLLRGVRSQNAPIDRDTIPPASLGKFD